MITSPPMMNAMLFAFFSFRIWTPINKKLEPTMITSTWSKLINQFSRKGAKTQRKSILVAADVSPLHLNPGKFEPTHVGCYINRVELGLNLPTTIALVLFQSTVLETPTPKRKESYGKIHDQSLLH